MAKLRESGRPFGVVVRNREVRRLEGAWAITQIAAWAYSVAIVVYTFDAGGAELVGLAVAIKILPSAIAAPLFATLADRRSKRLVLVGSALALAAFTALIALMIVVDAPVPLVIGLAAVVTVLMAAGPPAVAGLLPELCEEPDELTAANVVNSAVDSLSIFVGPAIGALVIGVGGPEVLAAATAAGFVGAAALTALVREPSRPAAGPDPGGEPDPAAAEGDEPHGSMLRDVADGFAIVRRDGAILTIVALMAAQTLVDGSLSVLIPVAAFDLLESGESGIGVLNAAIGVGALLGTIAAAGIVGRRLGPPFALGMALWGAPLAALALLPFELAAVALFAVIGIGNVLIDVSGFTMLQRAAPEEAVTRVLGVLEAAMLSSVALGALLTPLLLDLAGTEAAFAICGLFLPVLALLAWPRLRRVDAAAAPPSEALAILGELPMFAALGMPAIADLARATSRVAVPAGTDVFRQGDVGERFYVIVGGRARVLVDGAEARIEGPREHFGEIALLRQVPRTATVEAVEDLDLLCLEGPDFVAAVSGDPSARGSVDSVIKARLDHMRPALGTF